jgi:hypothetical protein
MYERGVARNSFLAVMRKILPAAGGSDLLADFREKTLSRYPLSFLIV